MRKLNEENLINMLYFMGLIGPEIAEVKLDEESVEGSTIASVGPHRFIINKKYWVNFVNLIEASDFNLVMNMFDEGNGFGCRYEVELESEEDSSSVPVFGEVVTKLSPEIEDLFNQRMSGMVRTTSVWLRQLARCINAAQDRVMKDGEIIKDHDAMLTFDTPLEGEIAFYPCIDFIKPVLDEGEQIEIMRTKMTDEQIELYFGADATKILTILGNISEMINIFYNSRLVKGSQAGTETAKAMVTAGIINTIMKITPIFISFGGVDNWRLFGDLTPNSEACHAILDKEMEYMVQFLKDIPLKDGVDYYAIDWEHLFIYGRTNLNKTFPEPLLEESDNFHMRYSDGFLELFKVRMRQSDNRMCFSL